MDEGTAITARSIRPSPRRGAALALLLASCVAAAPAMPAAPFAERLADAGYVWMPELAPSGPVVIVVSLPGQLAYVYRNGVRIAVANVSTGRPGFDTPAGVYSILQKHREHFSNRYDNAPMPFMQRLSWDGVALHAGKVPGYPASHGCIRLPYPFAEKLFRLTSHGMTVVVADESLGGPGVAYPGLFAPVDPRTGAPRVDQPAAADTITWMPERAASGPVTIVLSTHDHDIIVMRDAVEIGRAPVEVAPGALPGTHVYVLLSGAGTGMSRFVPGRPALRWMSVSLGGQADAAQDDTLRQAVDAGQVSLSAAFARSVYDVLVPGTTLVVTDAPTQSGMRRADLLQADQASGGSGAKELK